MEIHDELMDKIACYFVENKLKLAIVESMSAGYFSAVWSQQIQADDYLLGGVVAFRREVKETLLDVSSSLIDTFTAESLIVTEKMVEGLQKRLQADIYIGITGLAYEGNKKHPCAQKGDLFLVIRYIDSIWRYPAHVEGANAADICVSAFNLCLYYLAGIFKIEGTS